jgi:SAM-dependent methyltransferase
MKPDATRFFVCPDCHGDLTLHSHDSREVIEGRLDCDGCANAYPVKRGVPRFVSGEDYADTFGRQWTRWARTQQDSLNGTTIFRQRLETYTGWTPESMAGQVVVDAGCGPGGFIDVIERHAAAVIGFDLSVAIDACYSLHGASPSVYLAQADIFKPPVRPHAADRLYSFGVVQHTPDPERAFRSLVPLVRPGGDIAVWVYRRHLIPQPIYWLRRFTAGMPEPRATRFIEWYVPKAMTVSECLGRVPGFGQHLRRLVPVADYRGRIRMTPEQYREWALMDTHDGLITRYTFPQRWRDLQRWMAGLEAVRRPSRSNMAAVARIPDDPCSLEGRSRRSLRDGLVPSAGSTGVRTRALDTNVHRGGHECS